MDGGCHRPHQEAEGGSPETGVTVILGARVLSQNEAFTLEPQLGGVIAQSQLCCLPGGEVDEADRSEECEALRIRDEYCSSSC